VAASPRLRPPPPSDDLVELDETVRPPRPVSGPSPTYPDRARRLRLEGSVLIEMVVTENGQAEGIRVLESAGAVLDEAVMEAVRQWRFDPASKAGRPVRTRWQYRHTFRPR
jgi:protein TonB